jgi:hypothetical protein
MQATGDGADPAQARHAGMPRWTVGVGQVVPLLVGPDTEAAEDRAGGDEHVFGLGIGDVAGPSLADVPSVPVGQRVAPHGDGILERELTGRPSATSMTGEGITRADIPLPRGGGGRP